jgi:hypothetical protein
MTVLEEFDPFTGLPANFLMIVYGVRRSGKNTMLLDMLFQMRERLQNTKVILFSGTAKVNKEQYNLFPEKDMYTEITQLDTDLGIVISEQEEAIADAKKGLTEQGMNVVRGRASDTSKERGRGRELKRRKMDMQADTENAEKAARKPGKEMQEKDYPHILIVLDDVVNESSVRYSKKLGYLATCGRHIHASVIILSQVIAGSGSVPPIIRTQADVIIMAALPRSEKERLLLTSQYMTCGTTDKKEADGILNQVTAVEYRVLVIETFNSCAREPEEYLKTYGPVDFPHKFGKWRLGTEEQWEDSDSEGEGETKKPQKTMFERGDIPTAASGKRKRAKVVAGPQMTSTIEHLPSFFVAI